MKLIEPSSRALARISELGVQKYTFGVNWVSNSFSSHCHFFFISLPILFQLIALYTKRWLSGSPKSAIGCPKDKRTPLWLKTCHHQQKFLSITTTFIQDRHDCNIAYTHLSFLREGCCFKPSPTC